MVGVVIAKKIPSVTGVCLLWLVLAPVPVLGGEPDAERTLSTVVVSATRKPTLVQDEPLHIEAVPAEEIEENLTVQPGNLSSLLTELPSVRVQPLAPALGGAGLQLRGMPAHGTLVLTDGLPLLGSEPDAFGLLQTPPLDLERVEVIKGAASALYGGSALGGTNVQSRCTSRVVAFRLRKARACAVRSPYVDLRVWVTGTAMCACLSRL